MQNIADHNLRDASHEPRVTCHVLSLWLRAVRPFAYPASAIPAIFGTALAYSDGFSFRPILFLLTISGVLFAHTAANLLSDYFDFRSGLDAKGKMGGSGILTGGHLPPRSFVVASAIFFFLAAITAFAIYSQIGNEILPLVALGAVVGIFYSFPGFGFKYLAAGEIAVFFTFGIGIGMGSYLVQTDVLSLRAAILSAPIGLFVAAILFANNMRDADVDASAHLSTLAGVLGRRYSAVLYLILIGVPYVLVVAFVAMRMLNPWGMLAFVSLPLAIRAAGKIRKYLSACSDISTLDAESAQICLAFGTTLSIGIAISSI